MTSEADQSNSRSTERYAEYPLNVDDYARLKHLGANTVIVQTIVPALCETETVTVSAYYLSTIPLKRSIANDPDSLNLLSDQEEDATVKLVRRRP